VIILKNESLIVVRIGKRGITEENIQEIKNVLKKHKIMKVKLLKNFREIYPYNKEEVAKILAEKTESKIVEIRGFTIILAKKKAN